MGYRETMAIAPGSSSDIAPRTMLPMRTLLASLLLCTISTSATRLAPASARLTQADWANVRAAFDAARHAARARDGVLEACNPGQAWRTRFDERGFTTVPDRGDWSWGLELASYGIEGAEIATGAPGRVEADGSRVSREWDSTLTEWYANDRRGLEHGFTIGARPGEGDGEVRLTLAVRGALRPEVLAGGRDAHFVDANGAASLTYAGLTVFDADRREVPARFEASVDRLCIAIDARGARYPLTVDPTVQSAYLKAVNTGADDQFGAGVAVSGDTVVVGAPSEDSNATGVNGDPFNNASGASGAVYVFVRTGSTWSQQAYIKASNTGSGDEFGGAVALDGNTLVVAARLEDSNATGVNGNQTNNSTLDAGAAYVFVRSGTTWSQQAYLKASNTGFFDGFGRTVAISGDTIAVAAMGEDSNATGVNGDQTNNSAPNAGAVYVFVRSGTTWSQQAYVKASNTEGGDEYAASVALSGDTLIVGAPSESSISSGVNGDQSNNNGTSSGAAYVYVRNGTSWSQQAYVKVANNGNQHVGEIFGTSVAISGDTAVVGGPGNSFDKSGTFASGSTSGAAYVFTRAGTSWSQTAYLKASNAGVGDNFGTTVAISGNTIVVGALGEWSLSGGVNGDQTNNGGSGAGAAYVFTNPGGGWSQLAYVKASNPDPNDQFSSGLAVSGGTLVVGASWEDSNATGIDGNASDNSAAQSGAAFVYDLFALAGTSFFGTGTPGCEGAQTVDANLTPKINTPGFALTCNNAPPSAIGLGLITNVADLAGSDPFAIGVLLHVNLFASTEVIAPDFPSNASGFATLAAPIPNVPALIGATYYAQAIWGWASCALPPFNLSSSRGLAITIQP